MNRTLRGLLYAIALLLAAVPAFAKPADVAIEPQPLSTALQALAKQTGVQIIFFSKSVEGIEAQALNGSYEPEDAVALLLEGTGLDYHVLNERAIEVAATPPAEAATTSPPSARNIAAAKMEEVEVTAKRQQLATMRVELQRLEQQFYAEYNKLNTAPEFDLVCVSEPRPGSYLTNRVCQPAFVQTAMRDSEMDHGSPRRICSVPSLLTVLVKTPEHQKNMAEVVEKNPELLKLLKDRHELAQRYEALRTGKPVNAAATPPSSPDAVAKKPRNESRSNEARMNALALVTCAKRDPAIDKLPTQKWAVAMGLEPAQIDGRQYYCVPRDDDTGPERDRSHCVSYVDLRRARLNRPTPDVRGFDYPITGGDPETFLNMNPLFQP